MSELILPPREFTDEVRDYGSVLMHFASVTNFPERLLNHPDHIMVKSDNISNFDHRVRSITPWAENTAFIEVDSRFLVAAQLLVPLTIADGKPVSWVEIMEPKSAEGTADYLGVEYAEFFHEDFNQAGLMMKKSRVNFEKRVDDLHRWWNVRLNDDGQELRITDKPLADIIDRELDEGTARHLKMAA